MLEGLCKSDMPESFERLLTFLRRRQRSCTSPAAPCRPCQIRRWSSVPMERREVGQMIIIPVWLVVLVAFMFQRRKPQSRATCPSEPVGFISAFPPRYVCDLQFISEFWLT